MADFRVIIIYFLWVTQDAVTWAAEAETQLLGYEETRDLKLHPDDTRGRTLITDPSWAFPSDATLTAFNVRLHGNALGSNVTLQIWRPVISETATGGTTRYSLVASTRDTDHSTTEHQRVELPVPQRILRGDVIGLYTPGLNPVPFHLPSGERDCNETGYLYIDNDAEAGSDVAGDVISTGSDVTRTFEKGGECRRYLVTAEYTLEDTGLQMSIIGDDVKFRTGVDTVVNSVVMPHSDRGFSAAGTLYGWKAYLQQPNQQVVFQVWRLLNSTDNNATRYVKVHESPPYSQPVPGAVHVRLRENERSEVNTDDVIALGHPLGNPIPYDWSLSCEYSYIEASPYDGSEGAEQEFKVATDKQACRKYSFQAEYYRAMPETLPMENATSMETNITTIPTEVQVTPTTVPPTLATPTTVATPTSTEAPPTTTPPATSLFGWEALGATRADGVRSGTVVPDVGRGFPADGKVIGWVFNASRIDNKIGLQVWRPMPEHPTLSPHARDFAYVGGTKAIQPWHLGENRFVMDQVGELPFPVRRGDVIALRLESHNPIPWVPSSDCSGRYYMDHHGQYSPCAQYIMQRTAVCRVYPIRAIVLWDDETDKKAPECDDLSASLVPSPPPSPTKKTHIDGCLILSIKSEGATYQLTNPDYPNITKHRDLCWVIHLEPSLADLYIQIKINDLDLRVPKKCDLYAADFLEVRDGEWSTSNLLRRYCVGWAADGEVITRTDVITACNHFLYIRLRTSTASYRFKGFKLHYQAVEKSGDGVHCVRSNWAVTAPSAQRGRNAAIITVVVVVVVIVAVCLLAYVRKVGFKIPQWLGARFFRHRLFHNQDSSFGQPDSPRHQQGAGLTNPELQPQSNGGLPASETSGYVTFVPGGYPTHGEPVLQLGKLAARPGTNANDSAVMEGITDISEPAAVSNGWPQAGNGRAQQGHGANGDSSPQFGISMEDNTDGGYSQNNNGAGHHYFNGFDSTASVT